MKCYRDGGCGPYESRACNECPGSKPDYQQSKNKNELENGVIMDDEKYREQTRSNFAAQLAGLGYNPDGTGISRKGKPVEPLLNLVLKPCPFCGSKGVLNKKRSLDTYIVECTNGSCPASYMIGNEYDSEEEAITAWNRRVDRGLDKT